MKTYTLTGRHAHTHICRKKDICVRKINGSVTHPIKIQHLAFW